MGRDVVADIPWLNVESKGLQVIHQFCMQQVNLAEIGCTCITVQAGAVLNGVTAVGVAVDTNAAQQPDAQLIFLTEGMAGAVTDSNYRGSHDAVPGNKAT